MMKIAQRQTTTGGSLRRRRGFTLTELLVVIAITAVLMAIMFVPLSRALDMTARANATVQGQDKVRAAMRRIVRDLSIATEVYEPRDLSMWGYNLWTFARNRPRPAAGAQPERYLVRGGIIAMRLPRMQYFDTVNSHYVNPADIDPAGTSGLNYDAVALDGCPRHGGAKVELRPVANGEPDSRITAYFIGLKNPGLQVGGSPVYENLLLFRTTFIPQNNTLNTYCLYRIEFDPQDPRYANWNLPSGQPNPDFFYDPTPVTVGTQTLPRYQWWKNATVTVMDSETSDAARWLDSNGKYMPHALCSWGPSPVDNEVAKPNREISRYLLGGVGSADLPALELQAGHGHWTGVQSDGKFPLPTTLATSPNAANGVQSGPRIEIIQAGTPVFDSQTGLRNRLVGYDAIAGRLTTSFQRLDSSQAAGDPLQQYYAATVDPLTYQIDLTQDNQATAGMPSSFGAAWSTPGLQATTLIVPGSDEVQKAVTSGSTFQLVAPMRRVGWTGLPVVNGRDPNNPTTPQGKDEYTIDYATGAIEVSVNEDWTQFQPLVRYRFQTNHRDDVVRVSYATKELATVNLGLVEYTRRRQESLPFEVAERVVIRNLKR